MTDRLPGTKFVLFGAVCLVAAAWIASVTGNLSRIPFLTDAREYEAVLEEASGLAVGDDVRIAGVDVGRVEEIRVERGNAVVRFVVEGDPQPTTTWQAGARWRNVIGQRFLYLYPNPGGQPLVSGDLGADGRGRIPVDRSVAVADLAQFVATLTPLLEAIDPQAQNTVTEALNTVLVNRDETIQSLVGNLSRLSGTIAEQEPELRSVLANANLLLEEYNGREAQLTQLIDQLRSVSGTLAGRSGDILDAAVDLAEVQRELGDMIEANDQGLLESAENIRRLTDSIGRQREAFEDSIASLRQGMASYLITSRSGEWFNVRAVAIQVQQAGAIVSCRTESNTDCAFPSDPRHPSAQGGGGGEPVALAPTRMDALAVATQLPVIAAEQQLAMAGGQGVR
jgi:phospholipid/cholesterol/gamma-HCH transport system substrate-binding protein